MFPDHNNPSQIARMTQRCVVEIGDVVRIKDNSSSILIVEVIQHFDHTSPDDILIGLQDDLRRVSFFRDKLLRFTSLIQNAPTHHSK